MSYHSNTPRARLIKRAGVSVSALFVAGLIAACGDNTTVGQVDPTTEGLPTAENTAVIGIEPTVAPAESPLAEDTPLAEEPPMTGDGAMGAGTAESPLTVAQIMEDSAAYEGQTVTVIGEAQQVYGSYGFKLDEDSWLTAGIDNDLPVIGATADTFVPDDTWINDQYLVTGSIRNYVQDEFERDFGWFTPDDAWAAEFDENQPVLIADSVQQVDPDTFNPGLGDADNSGVFGDDVPAGTLAVADVTGSMDQYAGQQVTVQGEVQNIYSGADNVNQALRLDDNAPLTGGIDNDLLVIGGAADTLTNPQALDEFGFDNTIVRVTGTVQEFSRADIESAIGYSLTDPIFDSWDGQPVLIADSIEIAGQQ